MKRKDLCNTIQQCVKDILDIFGKKNFIVCKDKMIFSLTEVYRTSNIIGDITFELESDEEIETELAERDLDNLARKIIDEKYKNYIYSLKFKKIQETDYISKIILRLNFEDINEYIDELCDKVYNRLGFENYEALIKSFTNTPLKYLMEEATRVYRVYKYNNLDADFTIRIENESLFSFFKEIKEFLDEEPTVKLVDKKTGTYEFERGGHNVFIRLYQKFGNKFISFKARDKYNTEAAVDRLLAEDGQAAAYTFKFTN